MFYLPGESVTAVLQEKITKAYNSSSQHASGTSESAAISLGYGLLPDGPEEVRVVLPGTLIQQTTFGFSILAGNQKVIKIFIANFSY